MSKLSFILTKEETGRPDKFNEKILCIRDGTELPREMAYSNF
ncbi:Uncharacterized protein dnm_093590 [Desulfonema magnum]|uniref:Uncharacterized protein n=1 Tax=Desulfonema magnum TaxID=45655 RepID=A0A975BXR5_9BACT|nr:Uncharacterized protein dnm_093590 [Desulfonema magnum]